MDGFDNPKFYNIAQAAEVIRMRYHSVWRMIRRGEIRAFKVGSRWRIPADFMDGFEWNIERRVNDTNG